MKRWAAHRAKRREIWSSGGSLQILAGSRVTALLYSRRPAGCSADPIISWISKREFCLIDLDVYSKMPYSLS
jgi:hypothetical protein